jgi:predicted AAA+ superfamily ATPase
MALPKLSDPLVGRMGVLTLYPFSSAEIAQGKGDFIERLFAEDFKTDKEQHKINSMIRAATFPEISGGSAQECSHWFDGYLIPSCNQIVDKIRCSAKESFYGATFTQDN